mgnify:CR=1 FL=1
MVYLQSLCLKIEITIFIKTKVRGLVFINKLLDKIKEYKNKKIEKVKKDYPDLNIKIICEVDINKMMSLLQNHEIDFAIIDTEIENSNIEIEELLKINNITKKHWQYEEKSRYLVCTKNKSEKWF